MKCVKVVKAKSTKSLVCAHTRARESAEMLIKRQQIQPTSLEGWWMISKGRGRSEGGREKKTDVLSKISDVLRKKSDVFSFFSDIFWKISDVFSTCSMMWQSSQGIVIFAEIGWKGESHKKIPIATQSCNGEGGGWAYAIERSANLQVRSGISERNQWHQAIV